MTVVADGAGGQNAVNVASSLAVTTVAHFFEQTETHASTLPLYDALGLFTALATGIAHPFWQMADPVARFHERVTFLEHIGLIGGLMMAAILRERGQ